MEFVLESKPQNEEVEEKETEEKPTEKKLKRKRIKIDSLEYLKTLENLASTQEFEDEEGKIAFFSFCFFFCMLKIARKKNTNSKIKLKLVQK